jgi:hypothetical protein
VILRVHSAFEDPSGFLKSRRSFIWAFKLGKKKAEKLTSHLAAGVLKIVGAAEGANSSRISHILNFYVDVSATFTRKELIMQNKIKSYFGRTNAEKNQDDS